MGYPTDSTSRQCPLSTPLIDGATRWQILTRIILPLAVPGLISAGIFAFTLSWNGGS